MSTPSSTTGKSAGAAKAAGQPNKSTRDAYVARQPIFDLKQDVFAYELLFRSGTENVFRHNDGDQATRLTIGNSVNLLGLEDLVDGRKAFINMTRQLLIDEMFTVLPPKHAVVEVLETVEPDAQVIEACRKLKKDGYLLALDDFAFHPRFKPLLELADFVKIDFIASTKEQRKLMAKMYGDSLSLLAEKVETREEVTEAIDLGYKYFQGYFFCKPEIIAAKELVSVKQQYLRFLQQVNEPDIDFDKIEQTLKSEVSLSVKLLRYLNSAGFGLAQKITSIKQALVLLGEEPLRKWASLVALTSLAADKPAALVVTCLSRARFGELIAGYINLSERTLDLFLMGMLSTLDAMLDRPLVRALAGLAVNQDVKTSLLGANTTLGNVYRLILACERADWPVASSVSAQLGLTEAQVAKVHRESLQWADNIFKL